jgi:hypothetical protein
MPFAVVARFAPAAGKLPELQARLMDRVTAYNAQGERAGLSAQMYGDGQTLGVTRVFPDLATIEAAYTALRTDPAAQLRAAQLAPLLHVPVQTELREVLAPAPPGPAPAFVTLLTVAPALGRTGEVRALLEERRSAVNARGGRVGLAQRVAPLDGPAFFVTQGYPSLAAFEEQRRQNLADPAAQAFVGQLSATLRQPGTGVLLAVIIPIPS